MAQQKKTGVQKKDIGLIFMTFLIGIAAGWYLYISAFAPQFNEYLGESEAVYEDLVVVGEQYGGMRLGTAPSFQLLKDGSFSYLPFSETGESAKPIQGTLPRTLLNEIKMELTARNLADLSAIVTDPACASAYDGIDYVYEITLQSEVYTLDTCSTAFTNTSDTGIALDKLWNYFTTLE